MIFELDATVELATIERIRTKPIPGDRFIDANGRDIQVTSLRPADRCWDTDLLYFTVNGMMLFASVGQWSNFINWKGVRLPQGTTA